VCPPPRRRRRSQCRSCTAEATFSRALRRNGSPVRCRRVGLLRCSARRRARAQPRSPPRGALLLAQVEGPRSPWKQIADASRLASGTAGVRAPGRQRPGRAARELVGGVEPVRRCRTARPSAHPCLLVLGEVTIARLGHALRAHPAREIGGDDAPRRGVSGRGVRAGGRFMPRPRCRGTSDERCWEDRAVKTSLDVELRRLRPLVTGGYLPRGLRERLRSHQMRTPTDGGVAE
jgi:hypothetical protein